ncbi:MAG: 1-deoxy-D-xylulose-5-phosphate reductoisomerase [Coriobacteriales bacterium]|nr:1-deoxy-D-xylulose-5-phosphate reductoisomerase [Coriobacteriales bacterium]
MTRKRLVVLGSTGSIGTQTLDVAAKNPDSLEVIALAAGGSKLELLVQQARDFNVRYVAVGDPGLAGDKRLVTLAESGVKLGFGPQAVEALASLDEADYVLNALVGAAGLRASYFSLASGKRLALANKESLVVGGDLIMPLSTHETLLPVDSEHGAIYQCLLGEKRSEMKRIWLTASGGPFRGRDLAYLQTVTRKEALAHPTWKMGPKISIDSSTLMNKGLEVIEAHHLFDASYDQITVLVHPQSCIHSMVEFIDGSVIAHLGATDMRIPIQFALSYPDRWDAPLTPLDFRTLSGLTFEAPDTDTFRCLALAMQAGRAGGTAPCVLNAANEVAVAAFLADSCSFVDIANTVATVLDAHDTQRVCSLEQLEEVDAWARAAARRFLESKGR